MPWKCRLQNQEYIVWLFAVPGDQYGAVCSLWQGKTKMSSKIEINAVTSHTADKNQKNLEIILIHFSLMLFGFRVQ